MKPSTIFPFIRILLIFAASSVCGNSFSQNAAAFSTEQSDRELSDQILVFDKCGYDSLRSRQRLTLLGPGWGYNGDSLRADLTRWRQSPYVRIDSVGASVQNRPLWLLTVTDTSSTDTPRIRVWVHARTHPNEVQAWWVTDEMINLLLSEDPLAQALRRSCIFNIMPMYNPDGVELGFARENANGVDIESNWNKATLEPEVQVLKGQFEKFMASESPIRIQLNMHSAFACRRFFVYHHANGTSQAYAEDEKNFIGEIVKYWPEGIEDWSYRVSWNNSTPTQFPESWFWLNHGEAVMALTYEDMNCDEAGEYDRTALALLGGVADYLDIERLPTGIETKWTNAEPPSEFSLSQLYPNPVGRHDFIRLRLDAARPKDIRVTLFDILGRRISQPGQIRTIGERREAVFRVSDLPSGTYFLRIEGRTQVASRSFIIVR